jgi:hypothetical protein
MTTTNHMDKRDNVFLGKMLYEGTCEELDQLAKLFAESRKETMEQLGYKSCEEGKPHLHGEGPDYDRGYNRRYQEEQIAGAK